MATGDQYSLASRNVINHLCDAAFDSLNTSDASRENRLMN